MLSLRACAAVFRSTMAGVRSSIIPSVDGVINSSAPPFRSFSATSNPSRSILSSTLPALAFRTPSSILDGCNSLLVNPSRSIMKNFWPRPREKKRIKNHGWKTRMSTPSGRRIIMRRILRGRHVLSH